VYVVASRTGSNEYPAVIVTIEERLRVKSEATRDNFFSPLENAYGQFCLSIAVYVSPIFFYAAENFGDFVKDAAPSDRWSTLIPYWLLLGPLVVTFWLLAFVVVGVGLAVFLVLWPIPMWLWMFGIKCANTSLVI
jgi:hypothetical protein